jgi:ubiquinone/menaquinone biosynthesis C-methylase UbiE
VTVDLVREAGVNIQGDAHAIPLLNRSVDCVMCISVLEYVASPPGVIKEIYRVLKPGGIVYLRAPFLFPYHPPPDDLFRFSMAGLRTLAGDFEEIQVGFNRGPASTFCR